MKRPPSRYGTVPSGHSRNGFEASSSRGKGRSTVSARAYISWRALAFRPRPAPRRPPRAAPRAPRSSSRARGRSGRRACRRRGSRGRAGRPRGRGGGCGRTRGRRGSRPSRGSRSARRGRAARPRRAGWCRRGPASPSRWRRRCRRRGRPRCAGAARSRAPATSAACARSATRATSCASASSPWWWWTRKCGGLERAPAEARVVELGAARGAATRRAAQGGAGEAERLGAPSPRAGAVAGAARGGGVAERAPRAPGALAGAHPVARDEGQHPLGDALRVLERRDVRAARAGPAARCRGWPACIATERRSGVNESRSPATTSVGDVDRAGGGRSRRARRPTRAAGRRGPGRSARGRRGSGPGPRARRGRGPPRTRARTRPRGRWGRARGRRGRAASGNRSTAARAQGKATPQGAGVVEGVDGVPRRAADRGRARARARARRRWASSATCTPIEWPTSTARLLAGRVEHREEVRDAVVERHPVGVGAARRSGRGRGSSSGRRGVAPRAPARAAARRTRRSRSRRRARARERPSRRSSTRSACRPAPSRADRRALHRPSRGDATSDRAARGPRAEGRPVRYHGSTGVDCAGTEVQAECRTATLTEHTRGTATAHAHVHEGEPDAAQLAHDADAPCAAPHAAGGERATARRSRSSSPPAIMVAEAVGRLALRLPRARLRRGAHAHRRGRPRARALRRLPRHPARRRQADLRLPARGGAGGADQRRRAARPRRSGSRWEAVGRLREPGPPDRPPADGVIAALGLAANLAILWFLHGRSTALNARSAFLHVLSDAVSSVARPARRGRDGAAPRACAGSTRSCRSPSRRSSCGARCGSSSRSPTSSWRRCRATSTSPR